MQVTDRLDSATVGFLSARPRLFGIAYRIVRSPLEAEDVVQEAWLRWQGADHAAVLNPEAFLATTTTRLALNDVQSARRRYESPSGPWLPEAAAPDMGPDLRAERSEAVEKAVGILLAKLGPRERAPYVLREVFDYPYARIAELLNIGQANCRQVVRRARQRLAAERQQPVSPTVHRRFLAAFRSAALDGNCAALEGLLVADASPYRRRMARSNVAVA